MYVKDEGFCADENGTLGGSSLTMNIGLRNLIESCGFSENDSINMATVIPAQTVGLDDRLGSIAEGKEANLTVLDSEYNCRLTVCHGEILYRG
jgi:N-acetylglucosamine-6-phosphate deacetylase